MKKFVLAIVALLIAEVIALFLGVVVVDKLGSSDSNYDCGTDNYEVRDSTDMEHFEDGDPLHVSMLYHKPTGKVVRLSREKYNYEYMMDIIGESSGYALVKDNGYCNVYGPDGNPVFKEDRKYSSDYYKEVNIIHSDQLIADYGTGEYFDMKGNPVSNFYTQWDSLYHNNPDLVNLSVIILFVIVAFLLWYFLLWNSMKRKCNLPSWAHKAVSILLLIFIEIMAFFFALYMLPETEDSALSMWYPNYKIDNVVDAEGNEYTGLLFYDASTNSNKLIRRSQNDIDDFRIETATRDNYISVKDGSLANVYTPDGKAVFDKDFENGVLSFVDNGQLIVNRMTDSYYDLKGEPVSNLFTSYDKFRFHHIIVLRALTIALFMLVGIALWYFLSGRRLKRR